ncbi:stage II sporulation protein M [Hathewaya massiliensis]|uniref:stage II sporulation protein M n=1 Tax=Hathewaya massiliensis TaxID=1964382 RepID=UPI001159A919|nr:stage II sporulation protein M [Hathewaya massiliensis]
MIKVKSTESKIKSLGILHHINNNIFLYLLCLIFLSTGIVLGFYNVKYMPSGDKSSIIKWIDSSLNILKSESIPSIDILISSISNYVPFVLMLWFLGMTIVGIPVILGLNILKGYALGFSFYFIINNFGIKGIWVGIGSILLQNIIFIPCIMILSVYAMEFSINILKGRLHNGILVEVISYSLKFILVFIIMFLGFFIEAYIAPNIFNYLSNALGFMM